MRDVLQAETKSPESLRLSLKSYLDSSVTAEVKVKLVWVGDVCVHCGASRNVSTSSHLIRRNNVTI